MPNRGTAENGVTMGLLSSGKKMGKAAIAGARQMSAERKATAGRYITVIKDMTTVANYAIDHDGEYDKVLHSKFGIKIEYKHNGTSLHVTVKKGDEDKLTGLRTACEVNEIPYLPKDDGKGIIVNLSDIPE